MFLFPCSSTILRGSKESNIKEDCVTPFKTKPLLFSLAKPLRQVSKRINICTAHCLSPEPFRRVLTRPSQEGPRVPCRGQFWAHSDYWTSLWKLGRRPSGQFDLCSFCPRRGERAMGRSGRDCALPRGHPEGVSHITSSQRGAARGVREGSCPGDLLQGHPRRMKQRSRHSRAQALGRTLLSSEMHPAQLPGP